MSNQDKEILTISELGTPLTVEQHGIVMPANYSFACVNDYVHRTETHFEELQALCLGMATHIEKLEKDKIEYELIAGAFLRLHDKCYINAYDPADEEEAQHIAQVGLDGLWKIKPHLARKK